MTVYDFTPKVDSVDTIYAADINELQAAIEEISARSSGGGDTYPMNSGVWYDNSTAMAGKRTGSGTGLGSDTIAGGLIKVTDPDGNLTSVGVQFTSAPASPADVRFAIYEVSDTGSSRGLPGAKLADLGVIELEASEGDWQTLTCDVPVSPGYYWVCVATPESLELAAWNINDTGVGGGMIGVRAPDGGNYAMAAGVEISYTDPDIAMPSTLAGDVDSSDRVNDAPQIFFKITPN